MSKAIKIRKTAVWQIVSLVLLIALVASIWTKGFRFGEEPAVTPDTGDDDTTLPTSAADALKLSASDVVKGSSNAKVTIIIYSDPSCPFCGGAAGTNEEVVNYLKSRDSSWIAPVPGIMENYVDTGKARIAFRYFPGHGKGVDAMNIMLCANEEGKFWELHDIFFANQALMEAGNTAGLKKLAVDAGINSAKLDACLSSDKYAAKLESDTASGSAAGISGTPAFFVNDKLISGAVSFKTIKTTIDSELAK